MPFGAFVHLLVGRTVVGIGQYLGSPAAPIRTLHGHDLKEFPKEGQDLVAVRNVQVFEEFKHESYPYNYHCLDGPPEQLGDLNDSSKSFKAIIAWDQNKLLASSSGIELGSSPVAVSSKNWTISATRQDSVTDSKRNRCRAPLDLQQRGLDLEM